MRQKRKRTPGIEEAYPCSGMSRVNPNAAGVDIGAIEHVIPIQVRDDKYHIALSGEHEAFNILDWQSATYPCCVSLSVPWDFPSSTAR